MKIEFTVELIDTFIGSAIYRSYYSLLEKVIKLYRYHPEYGRDYIQLRDKRIYIKLDKKRYRLSIYRSHGDIYKFSIKGIITIRYVIEFTDGEIDSSRYKITLLDINYYNPGKLEILVMLIGLYELKLDNMIEVENEKVQERIDKYKELVEIYKESLERGGDILEAIEELK